MILEMSGKCLNAITTIDKSSFVGFKLKANVVLRLWAQEHMSIDCGLSVFEPSQTADAEIVSTGYWILVRYNI